MKYSVDLISTCKHLSQCWLIIIIKRISRAPIYHTKWQHRALYNNTNHTHTASDEGMGRDVSGKNVLNSMIIKISM